MQKFARLPAADRADLFETAAAQSGLSAAIIEKDFWVCWMLERVWSLPCAEHLIFKGGTSLSKCFNLIQRFSEDIDIGLDRALLGDTSDDDLFNGTMSSSARNKHVKKLQTKAKEWIKSTFIGSLTESIRDELGAEEVAGWSFELEYDKEDNKKEFPKWRWNPPMSKVTKRAAQPVIARAYLKSGVLLEIGPRAAHEPAADYQISSYVAQEIPQAFTQPSTNVYTLKAERTFWEKATLLHVLNHETEKNLNEDKPLKERERISRHCYDLHCIAGKNVGQSALRDLNLLAEVVKFKRVFFCSSSLAEMQYDDAKPGTFHLTPHPELQEYLEYDYKQMQDSGMFFGVSPSWNEIQQTLRELQETINAI